MIRPITVIQCEYCSKDVEKPLYRVTYSHKRGKKLFCNKSCSRKYTAKQRRNNFIMPIKKRCIKCDEIKLLCEFPVDKRMLDDALNICRICYATYMSQQDKKRKYGITPQQEIKILESQGGVCAICGCPPPLYIDHNHVTGVVRGMVCMNCNFALGSFKDNPDTLRKAIIYLESEFNEN